MTDKPMDIRPSPIAGTWYPGDAESLAISIDQYLKDAQLKRHPGKDRRIGRPACGTSIFWGCCGAGLPAHPGPCARNHCYHVAAACLCKRSRILTSGHEAYGTPLGSIPIDQDLIAGLQGSLEESYGLTLGQLSNDREHSLEIELPFLQRCYPIFVPLLPIMVREQSAEVGLALGETIGTLLEGRDSLIVASSDLSHFYPQHTAEHLDQAVLRLARAIRSRRGSSRPEQLGLGFACGRGAIAAVLWAARAVGADGYEVLNIRHVREHHR